MLQPIARALKLDRFEPNRIVTSNLVRPLTLAILRGVDRLYTLAVVLSKWITTDASQLEFFTNLSYIGLVIYLVCSTIWSIGYLRHPPSQREAWLRQGSPWWGWLHWLLYSTVINFHIIVPIVYWSALNDGSSELSTLGTWQNVSFHAVDGGVAIFELVFNRHFLQPIHSVVVALIMVLYMLLTFVIFKTTGHWVYPFLDWSLGPICAVYYLGIAAALFVVFAILWAVHKYRNQWLGSRSSKVNPETVVNMNCGGSGGGSDGGRPMEATWKRRSDEMDTLRPRDASEKV